MCDSNPLEESFRCLLDKEISEIESKNNCFIIFPPLTSKLRFQVHRALENHPALQTVSVGIEPNRQTIIFKTDKVIKIVDVEESANFKNQLEEFMFRTGITAKSIVLTNPTYDFNIFSSSEMKLDAAVIQNYSFVLLSHGVSYGEIRRTLRSYYRKGSINCYALSCDDHALEHILICDTSSTSSSINQEHASHLNLQLLHQDICPTAAKIISIMSYCGNLKPPATRAFVDRSAAANIMSRHLGISRKKSHERLT